MNLVDRPSVHLRFRFGNPAIDRQRVVPHRLRQVQMREQMLDFMKPRVMVVFVVMTVFMRMLVQVIMQRVQLLRAMDQHLHVRARDAALDRRLGRNFDAGKAKAAHHI